MKSFRTELHLKSPDFKFGLQHPVFTIGSCFADQIGTQLKQNKFNASINPLGIIYNPLSIHRALHYSINADTPGEETYVSQRGLWNNYDFHSLFSTPDREEIVSKIKQSINAAHNFLRKTEVLIITYGTAWAYEQNDNGELVANCHKVDSKHFNKVLQTPDQIEKSFHGLYEKLKSLNKPIKIILTVSPVRHIKDTLELNQVSKSILRLACHNIQSKYSEVEYFPAYEIMMDDLRDYRFYERDMIHPSREAIEYIWDKFSHHYFDDSTKDFMQQWESISADLQHRAFHPEADAHQKFLKETIKKLEALRQIANVEDEIALITSKLTKSNS
jgi:GSCFA family